MPMIHSGTGKEIWFLPSPLVPPSQSICVSDGPAMGPMERGADNRSRVQFFPEGTFTNTIGGVGLAAESDGQTIEITIFDSTKIISPLAGRRAVIAQRGKGLTGQARKDVRTAGGVRQYVDTKRMGVRILSADGLTGDTDPRKVQENFHKWDDPTGADPPVAQLYPPAGTTFCGRPVLIQAADGTVYMFALYFDPAGSDKNGIKSWYYSTVETGIGVGQPYPYFQDLSTESESIHDILALEGLAAPWPKDNAQLAGCLNGRDIYLAVASSDNTTLVNVTKSLVGILKFAPGPVPDGAFDRYKGVASIDLLKAGFGKKLRVDKSGEPLGLSMDAGRDKMVLAVSVATRGIFSDQSTDHLGVLHASSTDGVTWGITGNYGAEAAKLRAVHSFESLADIPEQALPRAIGGPRPEIGSRPVTSQVAYSTTEGYACSRDGDVLITRDAGITWFPCGTQNLLRTNNAVLGLNGIWCSSDGAIVVAVGDQSSVIGSVDSGATWALLCTANAELRQTYSSATKMTKSVTLQDVVVLGGTEWVLIGDNAQVFYTTDGCATPPTNKRTGSGVSSPAGATTYYGVAIKDGVTKGVVIWGSPDAQNGNQRIVHCDDVSASPPTWVVDDVAQPQGEALLGGTKKSGGGSTHGHFGWMPGGARGTVRLDAAISRPAGTTTLHMDGFTTKAAVGDTFQIAGDDQVYTVTSATNLVGSDSDVTFTPGLIVAIPAVDGNELVSFRGGGMLCGALGVMIAFDSTISTDPVELLDENGNRWTSASLYDVAWVDGATRFVVGDGGEVLRTTNFPAVATSAGVPAFAEQLLDEPRSLRSIIAPTLYSAWIGGLEGWAVLNAALSNICNGTVKYLWDSGDWLLGAANVSQGEMELRRSTDGEHFSRQSLRAAGAVIRFAPSSPTNTITADNGTAGTPRMSFVETVEGSLCWTTGNSPTSGDEGIVSLDGGFEWKSRKSLEMPMPLGEMVDPADGETWLLNSTRETIAFNDGLLLSAAFNEDLDQVRLWMARHWSTTGTLYPPVVPGKIQYVGDRDTLANPKARANGVPETGDKFTSRPLRDHGPQNLAIESPSFIWRTSNFTLAGETDPVNAEHIWDRRHADIIAALGKGDHWDGDSLLVFGSNCPYLIFDWTIPTYDGTTFPTDPDLFIRKVSSAAYGDYAIASVVGRNVLRLTLSTPLVVNQFAPGFRNFYVLVHDASGAASTRAHLIKGNTEDSLIIDWNSTISSYAGMKAFIYHDRHAWLGESPTLASGGSALAATIAGSAYRFPRLIRISVPFSTNDTDVPIEAHYPDGEAIIGTPFLCTQTSVAAPPGAPASEAHRAFGHGYQTGSQTNTVSEVTPSNISSVEYFGDVSENIRLGYPGIWWSQRDQLVNSLVKDGFTRRAIGLMIDPADPLSSLRLIRLAEDPVSTQVSGSRVSLAISASEVR